MELRWHVVRTTRWETGPLYPDRFGSPTHTFKHTEEVRTLQYRNPIKGEDGITTLEWQDVPTVVEENDETHGESLSTFMCVTSRTPVTSEADLLRALGFPPPADLAAPAPRRTSACPVCGGTDCRCHLGPEHSDIPG